MKGMGAIALMLVLCCGCFGGAGRSRVPEPVIEAGKSLAAGAARVAVDLIGSALRRKLEALIIAAFGGEPEDIQDLFYRDP